MTLVGIVVGGTTWGIKEYDKRRVAAAARATVVQAAQVAAVKREREAKVLKAKQERVKTLGKENAALVESALTADR